MSEIDQQAFGWVARKFARGLSDQETAELDAWLEADIRHKGAHARAMAIYNALHLASAPESASSKLDDPAPDEDAAPRYAAPRRKFLIYGALAAGLGAAAVKTGMTVFDKGTVLSTAKGEFRKVPLQDTSIANINSGSQIEVAFTRQQRRIKLHQGEAWFEVAKDKSKPFIVEAGDARVRAVGTAFAVRRFANGTEVLVTEGTVEVWNETGAAQKRSMTAGERAFLAKEAQAIAVTHQPNEVNRMLAWREGKLILANQTLSEAVADFNRYSTKAIVVTDPALAGKRLVGEYQLDAPELFAKDVSMVLDVPVSVTADKIFIGAAPRRTKNQT
ncbi:FecR domain-containing protein [Massilia terrae]|uniref:FecR domain-containing protein n=1 Tax=Massilia terrae TaxID=1811224 RepID=A0ABT2CY31_9BURK|nr:FecR domain-containing protein [Massilia terrae]MCS0658889.1 FecR domain-containing protein [Massilia terrae]